MSKSVIFKGMKLSKIYFFSIFFSLFSVALQAQDEANIRFSDMRAEYDTSHGVLNVSFDIDFNNRVVSGRDALMIIPVYRSSSGDVYQYPSVLINGRSRSKYFVREQALMSHESFASQNFYQTFTLGHPRRDATHHISYESLLSIRESDWSSGELRLEQFVLDCCEAHLVGSAILDVGGTSVDDAVAPVVDDIPSVYETNVTFVEPEVEEVKERTERISIHIEYPVDKSEVYPHHANNSIELSRIDGILRPMISDSHTYQIHDASIEGWASPEAPSEYNLRLSERRAYGFRDYLSRRYGVYRLPYFSVRGMGEDWLGLRSKISVSSHPNRTEILGIIDSVYDLDARESRIKQLLGPERYRWMLYGYYPSLRRMDLALQYTVRAFDSSEVEEVIKSRPQDLSQYEIYQLARRQNNDVLARKDRKSYGREYDTAVRHFSDDIGARINASSAALIRGDLDKAWEYLSQLQDHPRAFNNLGVYYWLKGDLKLAKRYFTNVPESDKAKANRNLEQLQRTRPSVGK